MNLYDMQARQQTRSRQVYESRFTPSNDRHSVSKTNTECVKNEEYKPRNYCYDVKENIHKRPESGSKKLTEKGRYTNGEDLKPAQEITKMLESHHERRKEMYSNENVSTPRK